MLFKTLTLPNRLSLNLFSGNLVINIFIFPLLDHLLTQLVCYSFIIILIYEINNGSLQLFIFSLLSNKLLSEFRNSFYILLILLKLDKMVRIGINLQIEAYKFAINASIW